MVNLTEYSHLNPAIFEMSNNFSSPAFCDGFACSIVEKNIDKVLKFFKHYGLDFFQVDSYFLNYEHSFIDFRYKCRIGYGQVCGHDCDRIYVSLTGSFCRQLQIEKKFFDMCKRIVEIFPVMRVNRFDIAKDCFDKSVFGFLEKSNVNLRNERLYCGNSRIDLRVPHKNDKTLGFTLYIGNRASSSCFIRVYDKKLEQGIENENLIWHRMELELKYFSQKQNQPSVALNMLNDGFSLDDIFLHYAYNHFIVLKRGCVCDKKNKLSNINKFIDEKYKKFIESYTCSLKDTLHKTLCFANSFYLSSVCGIEKYLKHKQALATVLPRVADAFCNMTNEEILELLKNYKSIIGHNKNLEYKYFVSKSDIYGKHNFLKDIPFFLARDKQDFYSQDIDINPFTNERVEYIETSYFLENSILLGLCKEQTLL